MRVEDILTKSGKIATTFLRRYKDEVEEILKEWPSMATWAYCQLHNIQPRRCHCGKILKVETLKTGWRADALYCSKECVRQDEVWAKVRQATLEKYGVENPSHSKEVCNRRWEVMVERFGEGGPLGNKEVRARGKNTLMEKYGVDHPSKNPDIREKAKLTNLERYGYESPNRNPDVQRKKRATNLERYGGPTPMSSEAVKEKVRQTSMERYGVPYAMMSEEYKTMARETNLRKYGVPSPSKLDWVVEKQRASRRIRTLSQYDEVTQSILTNKEILEDMFVECKRNTFTLSKKMNVDYQFLMTVIDEFGIYRPPKMVSSLEMTVRDFLSKNGIEYIANYKLPSGMEIDVFIPSVNVGIECHGLYYHSYNEFATVQGPSDPKYHVRKHDEAVSNGFKLLQFFEDDIQNKWDIVASMILNACGLSTRHYARKTEVKILDTPTARAFCESNHKDGYSNAKLALGLFQDDLLLSVMTFGKSRFEKREGMWEVIRFCTLRGHQVIGGGSKLVKAAKEFLKNEMTSLVTYADKMIGDGVSYEKMGFAPLDDVAAGYYWVFNGERRARQQFQKHKLHRILEDYDPNQTETVNMMRHGHRKLYNAGYRKFIMRWE